MIRILKHSIKFNHKSDKLPISLGLKLAEYRKVRDLAIDCFTENRKLSKAFEALLESGKIRTGAEILYGIFCISVLVGASKNPFSSIYDLGD